MKRSSVALLLLFSMFAGTCAFAQNSQSEKKFTMDGEFGFIVTAGNTETTSMSAGLNATQELDNWSNEYLIEGLYKQDTVESNGEEFERTTAQKFFASAQGNYKLNNPNNRLFVFASYEDDRFSNFAYQSTLAGGWNQKLLDTKSMAFEYSVGPGYRFAETQTGEQADEVVVRGAFNYRWKISDTARFTQKFSTELGADNTKSRAESALTAQIAGGLSMKLSIQFAHNTDVAPGVEKLDTETAATLVYSFF